MKTLTVKNRAAQLPPSMAPKPTTDHEWRIYATMAYITTMTTRVDRIRNGWYRDVKLKSGRVVKKFYRSTADASLWDPYLAAARAELAALQAAKGTQDALRAGRDANPCDGALYEVTPRERAARARKGTGTGTGTDARAGTGTGTDARADLAALEATTPASAHVCRSCTRKLSLKAAKAITGGLSNPEKMPCYGYNLPAEECGVGSVLRENPNTPCYFCYARKGRYVFHDVVRAMYRRLATLRHPLWVDAMVRLIEHYGAVCTSPHCAHRDVAGHYHFRWHDSGDIQDVAHLRRIVEVAERTPLCIHWIPTQEYRIVKAYRQQYGVEPANLVIRKSSTATDKPQHPWLQLPGVVASYVNSGAIEDEPGTYYCPSRHQDGKCGSCRACWSRDVKQVAYHVH